MSHFIAVDIGGTQMRAACFSPDSLTPEKLDRISTRHPSIPPIERLYSLISTIWPEDNQVEAIGVAVAGPVNPYEGILIEAPNIPGWTNFPLRKYLEERFQVPVLLGNDANLAALAEWKFGAGQGHHHLIYITVSTGIGGGIINDDRLLLGSEGLAGEVGHVTVVPDGPVCGCGHTGHLEAVASGPAIARWAEERISQGTPSILPATGKITGKMIGEAALQGDELARSALARSGTYLGQAIADFLHLFNPSAIIIGGGVSQTGPLLLEPLRTALEERILSPQYAKNLTITTAALGDEVGLIGAYVLALTGSKTQVTSEQ